MCVCVCVTYSGIQLLEQEEVLLNYNEKVNINEAAINKGNMALETLEKEMKDLQLAINEEKRQIELRDKEGPLKTRLEGEIATLQIEVGKIVWHDTKHNETANVLKSLNIWTLQLLKKDADGKMNVLSN